jgi:hypothetical protein
MFYHSKRKNNYFQLYINLIISLAKYFLLFVGQIFQSQVCSLQARAKRARVVWIVSNTGSYRMEPVQITAVVKGD